jgi:cytochrome P450
MPIIIVLSLWNLQRRPDLVGPNANTFNPSRWETWTPKKWEFIPFNHGVRTCIGQKFGMTQVKYILVRIAQEFETLSQPKEQKKMEYKFELNVKPLHGCLVCFERNRQVI